MRKLISINLASFGVETYIVSFYCLVLSLGLGFLLVVVGFLFCFVF